MRVLDLNRFSFFFNVLRKHGVVVGTIALALLLIGVLFFDGLIFYANVIRPREAAPGRERKIILSEKAIADTVRLLDDRQREFDAILNIYEAPSSAVAPTSIQ